MIASRTIASTLLGVTAAGLAACQATNSDAGGEGPRSVSFVNPRSLGPNCSFADNHDRQGPATDLGNGLVGQEVAASFPGFPAVRDYRVTSCNEKTTVGIRLSAEWDGDAENVLDMNFTQIPSDKKKFGRFLARVRAEARDAKAVLALAHVMSYDPELSDGVPDDGCGCILFYPESVGAAGL